MPNANTLRRVIFPAASLQEVLATFITTTQNGLFSMTLNLSAGSVDIDWGDGNQTLGHTGGAATNTYADGSSKNITITGDTGNVTSLVANSQSITAFDPSQIPNVGTINIDSNLFVTLDFSSNTNLTNLDILTAVNLTTVTLPSHGNLVSNIRIQNTAVTALDFSGLTRLGGNINCNTNSSLASVTFGTSSDTISTLTFFNCDITGQFDASGLTAVTAYSVSGNSNLTEFVAPTTAHACNSINFASCGITVNPDLSTMNLTGTVVFRNNSGITSINLGANTGITNFRADDCNLAGQADLDNQNGITNIELQGNAMTQAEVDSVIADIYSNRLNYTDATPVLNIGGSNSAPTGTFQVPAACPATIANERVYELVNDSCGDGHNLWSVTTS